MVFGKRLRRHLTYANVMVTLLAFVALGGGAYAVATKAPKDSVNSRSILDDSVKSEDVKDDSLTGTDIQEATLQGLGGGAGSGGPPSGPAGGDLTGNYPKPQIAAGAVGQNALGNKAVTASKLGNVTTVTTEKSDTFIASAVCPDGSRVISGSAFATSPLIGSFVNHSQNSWVAATQAADADIQVSAECLDG